MHKATIGLIKIKPNMWIFLAVLMPPMIAVSVSPSVTMFNHLMCLFGWGMALLTWREATRLSWDRVAQCSPLWLAVAAVVLSTTLSWHYGALPSSLALSYLALLLGAAGVSLSGALIGGSRDRSALMFDVFAAGVVLAGVLSTIVGVLQVFAPSLLTGQLTNFIAPTSIVGRAVGNLRQPNHLSSWLIWALIALVPLAERRHFKASQLSGVLFLSVGSLMVLGVVLTASRTGVLGILLIALWGIVDRRLSRQVRWSLWSAPLLYVVFWLALSSWAQATQHTFGGEARLAEADLSASRFGIWANTWAMISQQPWTGVGLGQYNFAWTFTPFPGRPTAFFDHSHNLPLQLLVELGVPLGLMILALLIASFAFSVRRAWRMDEGPGACQRRAAVMMLLLIGLHSLLEYPLWYSYFLLPAAWLWGFTLVAPSEQSEGHQSTSGSGSSMNLPLQLMGLVLAFGAAFAALDYWRVVEIYLPSANAPSLEQRIARGQRSVFYRYQADYALVTTMDPADLKPEAFSTTTHALLDARLMMAWSKALEAQGRHDEARYVAARLKEFRNPLAKEFFAACDSPRPDQPLPFQCQPPSRSLTWRDLLPKPVR